MNKLLTLAALGLISSAAGAQEQQACDPLTLWLGGQCAPNATRDDRSGQPRAERQISRRDVGAPSKPDISNPPGKGGTKTPPTKGDGGTPTPPNNPPGTPPSTPPGRPPGQPPGQPGTPTPTAPIDDSNPDGWNVPSDVDSGGNFNNPDGADNGPPD